MSSRTRPIPILFVIDFFRNPHAGTEGQLCQLITGLDRRRFEPTLLVFKQSEYLDSVDFPCAVKVLGHSKLLSIKTWLSLWVIAKEFRLEGGRLSHVFFNDPSVICPPIFRMLGIRTIISRRDMGYWYTPKYLAMLNLSGRFVSLAIANSQAVRKITIEHEPFDLTSTHVIYNGYEFEDEHPAIPADLKELREEYPDAVFAVIVANIRPIKRVQDAVRALGVLSGETPALHLVIIGDGDPKALKATAKKLGIEERVHFLGARRDVKECLTGLDIGLLCSESEGFSNSLVEYMQAGLPVVCSAVGGNPEAITHGETGFLYSCGNLKELADCLKRLVTDSELRVRLGGTAKTSAMQRFSMETMVRQHQEVYDSLLNKE
ncbi:glycosyltransferase [Marinobacter shengliensis]|uniref:glycosyltransferase n=1 Tax=Marinobacter shengliensis TaxID=1389223 RepID=UPI001E54BA75|nr:glycosyltransferase [Marinobacter shengliensis]MCD1631307.1 glycosyltransferase [Marinobacter shengliensis]